MNHGYSRPFLLLLVLLTLFQTLTIQRRESYWPDSSIYMVLAANLLKDGQYEFNERPHTIYPPGFPGVLAGLSLAGGGRSGYEYYIWWMPLLGIAGIALWFFALRLGESETVSAIACLLTVTSTAYYKLATQAVASETAFLAATGGAAAALMKLALAPPASRFHRRLLAGLLLLSAVAAVLIRSAGIALVAALLAWAGLELLRVRWRRALSWVAAGSAGLAGLLAFAGWTAWSKQAEPPSLPGEWKQSYVSQLFSKDSRRPESGAAAPSDLLLRAGSNMQAHLSHLAAITTRIPYVRPTWISPLVVATGVLLVAGLAAAASRPPLALFAFYFLAYFGLYILWPFEEGPRFMLPVAPAALALMLSGGRFLGRLWYHYPGKSIAAAAALCGVLGIASWTAGLNLAADRQTRLAAWLWPLAALGLSVFVLRWRKWGPSLAGWWRPWLLRIRERRLPALALLVLAAADLAQQAGAARQNLHPPARFRHDASAECAAWLRQAPPGTVMAQQWAILHRLTGRRVAGFPVHSDPAVLLSVARRERVRYLVVSDPLPHEYFIPSETERWQRLEAAQPGLFREVHRGDGYRIMERPPDPMPGQ